MPRLDEVRDVLLEVPEAFGLRLYWPYPRMDGPQVPVLVKKVEIAAEDVKLHLDTRSMPKGASLVPSDVCWHQLTGTFMLVTTRIDFKTCRVEGLVFPEEEDAIRAFHESKGEGHWVCVGQGWKQGWELPPELKDATELVKTNSPDVWDLFPNTRKHDRVGGWVAEGRLDPDKMLSHKTSRFLQRQREAMTSLFAVPDECSKIPDFVLGQGEPDMEKGEIVDTFIPMDGSGAEVKRTSRRQRKGGVISSGAKGREKKRATGG